jgi:hypothetical protein
MLTVEDCLASLETICDKQVRDQFGNIYSISNTWDRRFINDVAGHAANGQAISTGQCEIVLKLLARYREFLIHFGIPASDLDVLMHNPLYAIQPYPSTVMPREVRWAGDNKLVFRYKYNAGIVEDIKKLKGVNCFLPNNFPSYNRDHKLWIVDVNSGNWEKVMDVIRRHNFSFDGRVEQYFVDVANSVKQPCSIKTDGQVVEVVVRDDDFLNAWMNGIKALES